MTKTRAHSRDPVAAWLCWGCVLVVTFSAFGIMGSSVLHGEVVLLDALQTSGGIVPVTEETKAALGSTEASVVVNPLDSNNVVVAHFRAIYEPTQTLVHFSKTQGLAWSPAQDPWWNASIGQSDGVAGDPFLAFDNSGNVFFVFTEPTSLTSDNYIGKKVGLGKSADGGMRFQYLGAIAQPGSEVQFSSGETGPIGKRILSSDANVDFPKATVDTSPSPFSGRIYVTFAACVDRNGDGKCTNSWRGGICTGVSSLGTEPDWIGQVFVSSSDGGITWSPILALSDSINNTTFQINPLSIGVDAAGTVFVPLATRDLSSLYVLRGIPSPTGTVTFTPKLAIRGASLNLQNLSWAGIAANPSTPGPVYLYFQARSVGGTNDDVYVARSLDGGETWNSPILVHDAVGAQQCMPFSSVSPGGRVDVVWTDTRLGGGLPAADIYYAYSLDHGVSFSPNLRLTPETTQLFQPSNDYWTVASTNSMAYVAYARPAGTPGSMDVFVNRVSFPVFSDGFDDCDLGGWTVTSGTGNLVEASSVQSFSPYCSLHILKTYGNSNPAQAVSATVDLNYSDEYYLDSRFYLPAGVTERALVVAYDGRIDARLKPTVDGSLLLMSGLSVAVTHSVWHRLTVFVYPSNDTYTALLDGTLIIANLGVAGLPVGKLTLGTMCSSCRNVQGEIFYDDIRYVGSPPPVVTQVFAPWSQLALGQTMSLTVLAQFSGAPVSGASVTLTTSSGLRVSPATGATSTDGTFNTTAQGTALGTQSVTVTVSTAGLAPGTAMFAVGVIDGKLLAIALTSDTTEMMSYETATIRARLTDGTTGSGVLAAEITTSSLLGGNFSSVTELGGGDYVFHWDAPFVTSQTYASIVVRTKVGGYQDASGTVAILVDPNKTNPANPTQLFLTVQAGSTVLASGQTTLVTVHVYTSEGYVVRGATVAVYFRSNLMTASPVADRLNGVYTFAVTAGTIKKDTWITLTISASKYGYATGTAKIALLLAP